MSRTTRAFLMVSLLGFAACATRPAENKTPCFPASGSLTIGNEQAKGALIIFVPKNEVGEAKLPRPRATVANDGTFKLSTFATNDGAPAGDYGVIVLWPGNETDDRLDGRYNAPEKTAVTVKIASSPTEIPAIKLP